MYGMAARYDGKVGRQDILDGVPQADGSEFGMNFLMLGSDSRGRRGDAVARRDERSRVRTRS